MHFNSPLANLLFSRMLRKLRFDDERSVEIYLSIRMKEASRGSRFEIFACTLQSDVGAMKCEESCRGFGNLRIWLEASTC